MQRKKPPTTTTPQHLFSWILTLGNFELGRLEPVTDIGKIGSPLQDLLNQRSGPLRAEFELRQGLLEGQSGGKLADQIELPRRVPDVLLRSNVRPHLLEPPTYDGRLQLAVLPRVQESGKLPPILRLHDLR